MAPHRATLDVAKSAFGQGDERVSFWAGCGHGPCDAIATFLMTDENRALAEALAACAGIALDDALAEAVEAFARRARGAHPDLEVSAERWALQLWTSLKGAEPDAWPGLLDRAVAPDLLLAVGLSAGDPYAVGVFEHSLVPRISSALRRFRLAEADEAELMQQIRVHILVPNAAGSPARISKYAARGSLEGWLRTLALRYALEQRGKRKMAITPDALERLGTPAPAEPSGHGSKRRRQLRAAVGDAFAELSPRDRRLLRARYVDGKTATLLATEHDVHESTMSRWLASARAQLETRIRARARALIGPEDAVAGPMVETLISDIEVSLRGLFDTRHARS